MFLWLLVNSLLLLIPARWSMGVRGYRQGWFGCSKWNTNHPRCQSSPQWRGWDFFWSKWGAWLCILITRFGTIHVRFIPLSFLHIFGC